MGTFRFHSPPLPAARRAAAEGEGRAASHSRPSQTPSAVLQGHRQRLGPSSPASGTPQGQPCDPPPRGLLVLLGSGVCGGTGLAAKVIEDGRGLGLTYSSRPTLAPDKGLSSVLLKCTASACHRPTSQITVQSPHKIKLQVHGPWLWEPSRPKMQASGQSLHRRPGLGPGHSSPSTSLRIFQEKKHESHAAICDMHGVH